MLRYYSIIFSFFLTSLLTFSCAQEETVPPPDNLLKEQQMVELLVATHILEQQIAEAKITKVAKEDSFNLYQNELFQQAGIDSNAFFSSYDYYISQVDLFHQMMVSVADSISYLRDQALDNPTKNGEAGKKNNITADSTQQED